MCRVSTDRGWLSHPLRVAEEREGIPHRTEKALAFLLSFSEAAPAVLVAVCPTGGRASQQKGPSFRNP